MAKIDFVTKSLLTSNSVRINLYKEPDHTTVIASQVYASPHPQRIWTFLDLLPGENYYFKWSEIDGSSLDIQVYAAANFTVPAAGSIEIKAPVDITAGVTTGLADGDNTYTNIDWIGWEPAIERIGFGTLQRDVDYGWDIATGEVSLYNIGDIFQAEVRYNVTFLPRITATSNQIIVRDAWSENIYITDDLTLTAADFNKNAIIKGNNGYLKITLPDIFTVVPNRLLYFESTEGSHKCAEITCSAASGNGNLIKWPQSGRNSTYVCNNESFAIYREKVSDSTSYWRVKFADGNFKTVGTFFLSSLDADDIINAIEVDGRELDYLEYARVYNDVVLKQNPANIVTYAAWPTGTNIYKFSDKNVDGKFRIPDLRGMFLRPATAIRAPGVFEAQGLQSFNLEAPIAPNGNAPGSLVYGRGGSSIGSLNLSYTGDTTRPNNVTERLFMLI